MRASRADRVGGNAPFVSFAEAIDSRTAVTAYVAMYPLLQRAYEELGEPIPYFNDRMVVRIVICFAVWSCPRWAWTWRPKRI